MNKYIVRIELIGGTVQDYKNLHDYMEQAGFNKYITRDSDGKVFHLPTAEYNISTNLTVDDILKLAKATSDKTGRPTKQLVTRTNEIRWDGLDLAD